MHLIKTSNLSSENQNDHSSYARVIKKSAKLMYTNVLDREVTDTECRPAVTLAPGMLKFES